MAQGKKNARGLRAHLVFLDESGFMLIPPLQRTWAPRGQTPVLRHRYRRDKLSVISTITMSPTRRRLGLYYQIFENNVTQLDMAAFLRNLLRHLRQHVILVWDQAAQLATLISAKVIGRALTEEDHRRLLDESLVEMREASERR